MSDKSNEDTWKAKHANLLQRMYRAPSTVDNAKLEGDNLKLEAENAKCNDDFFKTSEKYKKALVEIKDLKKKLASVIQAVKESGPHR